MKTCPTCKMKIEDDQAERCPRCHTSLKVIMRCEDCKGCSLFGKKTSCNKGM